MTTGYYSTEFITRLYTGFNKYVLVDKWPKWETRIGIYSIPKNIKYDFLKQYRPSNNVLHVQQFLLQPLRWRSRLQRSSRIREVWCSNSSRDRPTSYKQVLTTPLPNTGHLVRVTKVLGDERYKRMPLVTVGVARWRTLTARWPWVPSKVQNLQPFTGNCDVSILVKNYRVGRKTQNKQRKIFSDEIPGFIHWMN